MTGKRANADSDFDRQMRDALNISAPFGLEARLAHAVLTTPRAEMSFWAMFQELFQPLPRPAFSLASLFVLALAGGMMVGSLTTGSAPTALWLEANDGMSILLALAG